MQDILINIRLKNLYYRKYIDLFLRTPEGDENKNYYVGLQRFQTDGISQMTHNDEKDRYRNNGLVISFSNEFSNINIVTQL